MTRTVRRVGAVVAIGLITLGCTPESGPGAGGTTTTSPGGGTSTTTTTAAPTSTSIPPSGTPLSGVQSVSAGYAHACAVLSDATVACWGSNSAGQLGNNSAIDSSTPVQVPGLTGVTEISAGRFHTCALLTTGRIKCWGFGIYGQLGRQIGDTTPSGSPSFVADLIGIVQVSAGSNHTCAVRLDNTAWCWGQNSNGQLGNGSGSTFESEPRPVSVSAPPPAAGTPLSGVSRIAAGRASTCATTSPDSVMCWGANSVGQLGNGTTGDSLYPTAPTPPVTATAIGVGAEFACAENTGLVTCWGRNVHGQLGNNSYVDSLVPVATSITSATGLSVGARTVCVTGPARCWGDNIEGQLGNGTFTVVPPTGASIPAPVIGLPAQPTQIAVGETFVCSVTPDTHVWCWGLNSAGQLGVATPVQSASPVEVTFH
ncbi:MAG TPA: hypothetical protein PLS46_18215 [Microthrixaceae bacterium]|nr:hypothetical protein [Microthrixaceae bacterium]